MLVSTHDLQLASDKFDRLMLLKRTLIGFGQPAEVLTPANLQRRIRHAPDRACPSADGLLALSDTCCEGDEHSHD